MNCIQKQQLVSFPKVRIWKPWFRHFNNHKEFHNEGTVHLFSLMALFSYANFRSNERVINGERYMEAPGQWICKLGSLPRILRVHSKRQALEQLDYYEKYGFLTYEWLDKENEIIRFSITNWKEHCTSLQYNYYSYKGSGFFFFPLPVGRMLLRVALKTDGIVFSELDAIMDMWLHTILNDPKVRGSEYMPVVYYSNMVLVLGIVGTPYDWVVDTALPPIEFASFASVVTVLVGSLVSGSVSLIVLILVLIVAWNYMWRPVPASQRIPCLPRSCWVLWAAYPPMIGISKRLLLIPVLHPKYSVRNPSEPLATCILTMRMSLKSSGNIAAAELSIRQPKSWTCVFLSMASRETRAAKKTAIRLFCEEGSLWNML